MHRPLGTDHCVLTVQTAEVSRSLTLALSLQPLDRPHTHTEFTLACRVYIHWHCYCVWCVCVCERERVLNGTCKGVLVGLRTRVSEGSPLVVIFPMTLTFWRNKVATLSVTWKCSLLLYEGKQSMFLESKFCNALDLLPFSSVFMDQWEICAHIFPYLYMFNFSLLRYRNSKKRKSSRLDSSGTWDLFCDLMMTKLSNWPGPFFFSFSESLKLLPYLEYHNMCLFYLSP